MFEWIVKDNITAANAIYLEEKKGEEGRPFKARFLQAGLVKYDFGVCLLKKETIDKFVNTFIDCPVIINHKDKINKEDKHGVIKNIWFSPEDSWFWCSGYVDDEGAEKVEDEGFNVSCQYRITEYSNNDDDKLHNGNKYDKEILNGIFEHLAIVKTPRYEDAFIAVNAIMATNEDQWITIKPNGEENKGRHLLIKDGETPGDAIRRVYGDKNQKQLFDTSSYKKTKEDYKQEKEDKQKQYDKLEEQKQESQKQQQEAKENRKKDDAIKMSKEDFSKKYAEEMGYFEVGDYWEKAQKEKQEEKKEPEIEAVYANLLNDKRLMEHLRESIKAQKAENPDAKVGDTQIDSDRFISLYTDKLTPKEYNSFNWDKAEDMVFKKLEEMEKEAGFKDGKENKQETNKEPETVEDKINKIAEDYKDYYNEKQMTEFKKELKRFVDYHGMDKIDIEGSKKAIKELKPEDALERLKDSNNYWEKDQKGEKLREKFYNYVEKNNFNDSRIHELGRFINSFDHMFVDKIPTFEEFKDDIRYGFNTELALKYLADKEEDGFKNYFKDRETDKVRAGYKKFLDILGVNKASNSFIEQFKDMLYETMAEGIFNKLGEKHAK